VATTRRKSGRELRCVAEGCSFKRTETT
jgi:hypothetical protein